MHTLDASLLPEILRKVAKGGLPNLFVPRLDHFVMVETLPILGTGKLNPREVKRLALEGIAHRS